MIEAIKKVIDFSGNEKRNIYRSIVICFVNAMFSMLRIGAIYFIIEALLGNDGTMTPAIKALILIVISILGMAITKYFSQLQQTHAGYFMSANKRLVIGNKLKKVPMGFFNDNNIGEITGITTPVLDIVENMGANVLVLIIGGLINTLVFVMMIPIMDVRIGLIVLAGIVVYLMFTSSMEKKTRKLAPRRQAVKTGIVSSTLEYIQGMSVVKSFNIAGKGDERLRRDIEEYKESNLALERVFIPYALVQNIILGVFKMAIILASVYFYFEETMELSIAIMMIIVAFQVFNDVEQTDSGLSVLRIVTSSMEQANKIDDMPQMDENGEDFLPKTHDISIKNVSFSYDSKEILHNISLKIPTNTMTAFVGPSGAGKTTLAMLISRFWDVDEGSISIGGKDIKKYTLESLMSQISVVFQNVYLFADTVENNIKFGMPNATRQEVIKAAKMACCHEFIESLPDGYDTVIGEGGATLSGGEKQRISIARAIIKDAPIIILDEATANIDPENEDKLKEAFEALTRNKTVIMIAHRLNTIKNANQIVVVENGGITVGNHDKLMAKNGTYKRFVTMRQVAAGWKI